MDFQEFNKLVGGILLAGIVTMFISMFADTLVPTSDAAHGEGPAMVAALPTAAAGTGSSGDAPQAPSDGREELPLLLTEADMAAGQQIAKKKCAACHTFDKGGKAKIGPNLWGILGSDIARLDDYKYSKAMAAKEGNWSYGNMNAFLFKPKAFVKRTKMTFPGLKKLKDRAAAILYLRSLDDEPKPLP